MRLWRDRISPMQKYSRHAGTLAAGHLRRLAGFVVLAAALVVSMPLRGADKRIVLIAGKPSHPPGMHEFRAGSLLMQKALTGFPGITVQVYDGGWPSKMVDGARVEDSAALDNADAVLIYADGGRGNPAIQADHMKVLDALAAKGVGLGFAHYGVEVPVGPPADAMHRWIGGYYEDHYSVNPMWKPPFDKFPSHPVTRGVQPFATHDEWYFSMRWSPDAGVRKRVTPILVATPSDEVRKGPYVSPKVADEDSGSRAGTRTPTGPIRTSGRSSSTGCSGSQKSTSPPRVSSIASPRKI
jgi:hypothetical protein